ncbi:MAG: type II toxin-antitoxin system RelE/ParE family toxin [Terracidiphilus sp.]
MTTTQTVEVRALSGLDPETSDFPPPQTLQKWYTHSMPWSVGFLDEETKAAIDALPLDIRASFQRIVELIQAHGLDRIREPYLKHLGGPLREMRLKGKIGIARAIYVTAIGMRIVVVHVFVKKTQKTPRKEIAYALKKAEEVK